MPLDKDIPKCPVCRLPPRMGDDMNQNLLRIADGDVQGLKGALYIMCKDCFNDLLPNKALRLGKKVEEMTYGDYF